jgi:NAD(P)-dependent dehydrogenase (short-subunit alcohol dehydrogenase family)
MGILEGKVAAVTGAGRGLGRSHALALAREGAKVVINDPGVEWDGSGEAKGPADDVAKGFDIMVNNAGFLRDRMTFKMTEEEWDPVVEVHLKGTFNTARWATEYFREQNKAGNDLKGRIINTISHAGIIGSPAQPNYSAAKAGIACLTITWAREMEKYGMTSNAVCPLARTRLTTSTDAVSGMFAEVEEGKFDEMAPENVSPLVVYLASDAAQDINGHVFSIRGGKMELFQSWQVLNSIDIGKKWEAGEIGERIRELGDLGIPPIVF